MTTGANSNPPAQPTPRAGSLRGSVARAVRQPTTVLLVIIALTVIAFGAIQPTFLSLQVFESILRGGAVIGIVVIGEAILLVFKELDLSVGSVVSLSAVTSCVLLTTFNFPWPLAILIAVLVGVGVGAVNAVLIVRIGLPALIVTLGTLYGAAGLATVVSGGLQVSGLPSGLTDFARTSILGMPVAVTVMVAGVVIAAIVLRSTVFGRSAYAIGGNSSAALGAGVPVSRYRTVAFLISGGCAGLAGILLSARVGVADPSQGSGLELSVVTAAVVGGVSLFGGSGSVVGAFLGAVFILTVNAGLVQIGLDSSLQPVITGVLLIVAVGLDGIRRRFA